MNIQLHVHTIIAHRGYNEVIWGYNVEGTGCTALTIIVDDWYIIRPATSLSYNDAYFEEGLHSNVQRAFFEDNIVWHFGTLKRMFRVTHMHAVHAGNVHNV